jgi:ABC-type transport system involved in multi-copper enzyme maturation permease subunit
VAVTTITAYRSPVQDGRDGFPQLLHAEWTKLRTVRGWVIGMIVAILVTVGTGLLFAFASGDTSCQNGNGPVQHGAACQSPLLLGPGDVPVTDDFYFVHQPLSRNGSITVRVTSLTGPSGPLQGLNPAPGLMPWAKAGIIIKQDLSGGSAYGAMMVTGSNGVRMQWNYTGDTPGLPGAVSAASPRWLRLIRDGDAITGYDSTDGAHWSQVGAVHLAGLPSTVQAGLFAASPDAVSFDSGFATGSMNGGTTQDIAVFDHVSQSGAWPAGTWTGRAEGAGSGGYHQAAGQFTLTGAGNIAPAITGPGNNAAGYEPIGFFLIGMVAGLIAVIVVATMFMTAEYRRGLIRTTFTARRGRGRVLAAKATVIGAAAFVTGLAGAAGAAIAATAIAHATSYHMYPVPWPTELRAIAGTAALAAVAAVFALAVGTMVRRSATAVTIAIVTIVFPYFLAFTMAVPSTIGEWLLRITPAAGFAVQQTVPRYPQVQAVYTPIGGFLPLAPWTGFAVLCGWAAVALAGAACLLRRRDT